MGKRQMEVPYSEEALNDIEEQGFDWWSIHADEHPSGREHIGYIAPTGKDKNE